MQTLGGDQIPRSNHQQRCPGGEIGRHKGLKIPRLNCRAGSSPAPGPIAHITLLFLLQLNLLRRFARADLQVLLDETAERYGHFQEYGLASPYLWR